MSRRRWSSPGALLGYLGISILYFGARVAPHPGRYVVGSGGDPQLFVWSMGWWPHALLNGENPFVSHVVWAPDGINLAWTTTVPGIALAVAPVTLLFGPVVGYNTAAVLLPALAAWTAFLLCRHLTGSFWPSLAGGYLFGFSSYVLGQQLGHMHMSAVFLLPVVALVVLRFVEGELTPRGLVWRLGLALGLQAYLSTELLFTLTFALVVGLALAYALVPDVRRRLRALGRALAGAYTLAAVVAAPLLAYALRDFESGTLNAPSQFDGDVLNIVVPTRLVALGGGLAADLSSRFPGGDAERGGYLGLPLLVIVAWYAIERRRRPGARFLGSSVAVALLLMLGTALHVAGDAVLPLPWDLVARLPLFDNALPARFAVYASLAAAVAAALWSSSGAAPRWLRVALPVAAVLALAPALQRGNWFLHPQRPELFAHPGLLARCIAKNENLLIYPYGYLGDSMLWQAENDYRFRMAEAYLRPGAPDTFARFEAVEIALRGDEPSSSQILELARDKHVARVLSVATGQRPGARELEQIGRVQILGGVIVVPGCAEPPLAGSTAATA
jgi:hypothetical protein